MEYAVELRGITKRFGSNVANKQVDLKIRSGSIHGLLGENGAGKSTLMNVLYGLYKPEEGEIYLRGERHVIDSPLKAMELGIGMVHQHFMLARPLTVAENIMVGTKSKRGLDIGASEYVRGQILAQRNKGVAVLLISADLEEILQLSDRIAVIYDGRITGILPRGASAEEIGYLMLDNQKKEAPHGNQEKEKSRV